MEMLHTLLFDEKLIFNYLYMINISILFLLPPFLYYDQHRRTKPASAYKKRILVSLASWLCALVCFLISAYFQLYTTLPAWLPDIILLIPIGILAYYHDRLDITLGFRTKKKKKKNRLP